MILLPNLGRFCRLNPVLRQGGHALCPLFAIENLRNHSVSVFHNPVLFSLWETASLIMVEKFSLDRVRYSFLQLAWIIVQALFGTACSLFRLFRSAVVFSLR